MKLFVQGGKPPEVNITDKDFLAEGGEGKVYLKGNTVFKLYHDPNKMISPSKIQELQGLNQPNILNPKNILLDDKQRMVGYTMDAIKDSVPLCKLFTNDFWNRNKIDLKLITELIKKMQQDIGYIHSNGCVMVDGNEMNYLVDPTFKIPYFIDVDAWQTKSFPATAIMPSIRDWHAKQFTELSDWFSFAVVATQLFVGIHPYKGTHDQFKKSDMEGRMKANISIFNKDVRLPSAVRPLDSIPANYKEWLVRVLEKGERLLPPSESGAISMMVLKKNIISATQFIIELLTDFNDDIIRIKDGYVTTHGKIHKGVKQWPIKDDSTEVINAPVSLTEILVKIEDGLLQFWSEKAGVTKFVAAEDKMVVGNAIFVKQGEKLFEVGVEEFGEKIMYIPKSTWNVMEHSTKLFNGIVYQNILGTPWLMIPYEVGGKRAMFQKMIPELKGSVILEAKYENKIANIIAERNGKYESYVFKFDETFTKYVVAVESDVDFHTPNFVCLDNGICIRITYEDEVQIFSNRIDRPDCKVLKDPAVTFDSKLAHDKMQVLLRKGSMLYKFKMK